MNRKITILTLFLCLMTVTFPVIAQQKADTTYTFRSVPQKDMFYVPWIGNDTELALRANLLRWATLTPDLGTLTACYHAKGTVKGSDGATGGVAGRNYKGLMPYGGIITACYWGGNGQEQGIGEDQVGTGGTTMVTDSNWSGAKDAMNDALQSAGSEWQYELTGALPTLKKQ